MRTPSRGRLSLIAATCTCTVLVLAALFGSAFALAAPANPGMGDPPGRTQNWYMVHDRAGILDENQERSAINDAYRLNVVGIPTQVVTEVTGLNQSQADIRAEELRLTNHIESRPGADDGLLLYASVDPDPESVSPIVMSVSIGTRTLPRNGLTLESLAQVQSGVMAFQLADGHPARAVVYSLREMIYLEQYVPPAVTELTGWRMTVQSLLNVLGPALALAGCAWLLWRNQQQRASSAFDWWPLAVCGIACLGWGVMAVAVHSASGALSAIGLGGVVLWQAASQDRRSARSTARTLTVTPRPPGSVVKRPRASRTASR